jgi:hypothetical protein
MNLATLIRFLTMDDKIAQDDVFLYFSFTSIPIIAGHYYCWALANDIKLDSDEKVVEKFIEDNIDNVVKELLNESVPAQ